MTDKDYNAFKLLMAVWGEVCAGKEEDKRPSEAKVYFYFNKFRNVLLEEMRIRGDKHFDKNRWFPQPCDLMEQIDELQAIEDYNLIEEMLDCFYQVGMGGISITIIEEKLTERGKGYLIPLLNHWGTQIWNNQNPTAIRAQFIKSYPSEVSIEKIEQSRKQIEGKKPKLIPENVSETLEQFQNRIKAIKDNKLDRDANQRMWEAHNESIFEQVKSNIEKARNELHEGNEQ
jgi:hypothetical protein